MTADVSLKLFDLTSEFIKDKEKAKEVSGIVASVLAIVSFIAK